MTHYRKKTLPRFYQERKEKSYLVVFPDQRNYSGNIEAATNGYFGPNPSLWASAVSDLYLRNHCKRVHWPDIPAEWQQALAHWLEDKELDAIKAHYQNQ
jgi:hypothetical protein